MYSLFSTAVEHTNCVTAHFGHVQSASAADTNTIGTFQTHLFILAVYHDYDVAIGSELLNSLVAVVSYIDHSVTVGGYSRWLVELSKLSSFSTEAV